MATKDSDRAAVPGAPHTVGDEVPVQGGANQGVTPLTAMPTASATRSDGAPVPAAAAEESVRDESENTAQATTRARVRMPGWFGVLWSNRKARVGLIMLGIFVLVALLAPVLTPYDPHDSRFMASQQPSAQHWLGTTQAGQDVLSQLIYGTRTSLLVGALAGALATVLSLLIGMTAGYMQGMVDDVLSFFINLGLVVPALPLMVSIAAYAPVRGLTIIIVVIALTGWAWGARFKRAQVISLRTRDFITSAKFAGDGPFRIIFREVLPNMISLVVLAYIGAASGAIGAEAGLEFLGLGDPNTISWGTMLYWAQNAGAMVTGQWAWLAAPGLALALLTTALVLINFGVDALSNPQLREE